MARVLKGPKSDFQYEEKSLGVYFFEAADKFRDNIFQIDADLDKKETYYDARKRAIRTGIVLKKLGVTPNDVVVICSFNNIHNAIPYMATLYIGAKIASLDPTQSSKECEYLLKIVCPKVIFVEDKSVEMIEDALKGANLSARLIVIGEHDKYKSLEDISQPTPDEDTFSPTVVHCRETAIIFFSSGTTGFPKGICCSHYSILNAMKGWLSLENVDPAFMFHYTSLYWITASFTLVLAHITGGCRVIASSPSPEKTLNIFETYGVTFAFMAPRYTYPLCAVPNFPKFNLKSLRFLNIGGAGVNPDQLDYTRKCFKQTEVQLTYGMTEACSYLTIVDLRGKDKEIYKTKKKSSGKTFVDTEIKIVDVDTKEILGPNQEGEICFRSPCMFNGYYNQDTEGLFDKDGFFSTGDVGYYDEDEYIYVVDRIKDIFKYKSWHIVPAQIEQVLMQHPGVEQAVVFGVPHEIDGDLPAACIIVKKGTQVTIEDIQEFLNEKVSDRQRLRGGIKFVSFIFKTPSGKFQRRKMREAFLQGSIS